MAAMRSLMVASSVAFALACQDVYRVSRATRLPECQIVGYLQLLAVGCAPVPQSVSHGLDDPRLGVAFG